MENYELAVLQEGAENKNSLTLHFFLLHLLMENMFHLNILWVSEVTELLAGRKNSFNWQNANHFWKMNSNLSF